MRVFVLPLLLAIGALGQIVPGRYIVELSEPPAAEAMRVSGRNSAAAVNSRSRALRQQQTMRNAVAARGGRVLAGVDTIMNAVIVDGSGMDAAALRQLPGVVHVYPVQRVHASLNRALVLHNVPSAWASIGGMEKAGVGMKVAILDTGIDQSHPGFKDDSITPPEGYPKTSSDANAAYITKKVIVARSYEELNEAGWGADARDVNGHGTNAAMAAAGVQVEVAEGVTVSGLAPKAFLGNYRVLGDAGGGSNAGTLKAIDDAVKDGMDVINMSLGSDITSDPDKDAQVVAIQRAVEAGVVVVCAAGNAGPDVNTINSPAYALAAIAVGSSGNDRSVDPPGQLDPNRISDFSSRGPNMGAGLKPDLVAVGDNFFTADTTLKGGEIWKVTQGTSFASPVVAGGAAVLKAARPGLTAPQYRSLLINSAPVFTVDGKPAGVRFGGSGRLDLYAAVQASIVAEPTSIKFGVGGGKPNITQKVKLGNLGAQTDTFTITVEPSSGSAVPNLSDGVLEVAPNGTADLTVTLSGSDLAEGEYQGFLRVKGAKSSVDARIPYWYAVQSQTAAAITVLEAKTQGGVGTEAAIGLRVVDGSGLALDLKPEITVLAGNGSVMSIVATEDSPGTFSVSLKLGSAAGDNIFRVSAGGVTRDLTIVGQ